jgi:hypothetical protein
MSDVLEMRCSYCGGDVETCRCYAPEDDANNTSELNLRGNSEATGEQGTGGNR